MTEQHNITEDERREEEEDQIGKKKHGKQRSSNASNCSIKHKN